MLLRVLRFFRRISKINTRISSGVKCRETFTPSFAAQTALVLGLFAQENIQDHLIQQDHLVSEVHPVTDPSGQPDYDRRYDHFFDTNQNQNDYFDKFTICYCYFHPHHPIHVFIEYFCKYRGDDAFYDLCRAFDISDDVRDKIQSSHSSLKVQCVNVLREVCHRDSGLTLDMIMTKLSESNDELKQIISDYHPDEQQSVY